MSKPTVQCQCAGYIYPICRVYIPYMQDDTDDDDDNDNVDDNDNDDLLLQNPQCQCDGRDTSARGVCCHQA